VERADAQLRRLVEPRADRLGERDVEAGEQYPLVAHKCASRPGQGETGLPGARSAGDAHPPVDVERFQRSDVLLADGVESGTSQSGACFGFPAELAVRTEQVDHGLQADLTQRVLAEPSGDEPLDCVGAILEIAEREHLARMDVGRQLSPHLCDVGKRSCVLDLDSCQRRM